jgi:hypothetical protein
LNLHLLAARGGGGERDLQIYLFDKTLLEMLFFDDNESEKHLHGLVHGRTLMYLGFQIKNPQP